MPPPACQCFHITNEFFLSQGWSITFSASLNNSVYGGFHRSFVFVPTDTSQHRNVGVFLVSGSRTEYLITTDLIPDSCCTWISPSSNPFFLILKWQQVTPVHQLGSDSHAAAEALASRLQSHVDSFREWVRASLTSVTTSFSHAGCYWLERLICIYAGDVFAAKHRLLQWYRWNRGTVSFD